MFDKDKEIRNIIASSEMEGMFLAEEEKEILYKCETIEDCEREIKKIIDSCTKNRKKR